MKKNLIKSNKYRKFKNPKIAYVFKKTLVLFITCDKCGRNDDIIFKEERSIEILKGLFLTNIINK